LDLLLTSKKGKVNKFASMEKKPLNRIKVMLAEKNKTNKALAAHLNKTLTTVSRWCTNDSQPSIETLSEIAEYLEVDIRELLVSTKK
jgi:putative transcriptional regulator